VDYVASISEFFKSPKWMMNLLLGGVCVLIPIVGPIVVLGWLITGFWARQDQRFETFPDFDFSNFGKYLERGLWPFLVAFVVGVGVSIILVPLVWVLMIPVMLAGGLSSGGDANVGGCLAVMMTILMMLVWAVAIVVMMLVLVPLKIRASLTQDFAASFDMAFVKRFVALTWKEMVLSSLFILAASVVFTLLGMLVFCVGMYFAMVLVYFSWTHLNKQLYQLYLSRGGEPVPLSPKLADPAPVNPAI
jgi:MFS family permease